ncbi:VWA domain-containing protein [Tessaracoccus aquimaris]|uniref:VWA domain-containing protein n=1 Tax=Tessaracoccus aquimaris TaxID=1332264 RepID=UPI001D03817B|nr:VWA domain-containing protein [Tessaracoccus aquimaris]
MSGDERARRWRLVLGRYADEPLGSGLSAGDADLDTALGFVYDREYSQRGLLEPGGGGRQSRGVAALSWLEKSKALFPASTLERLQATAITEYGVSELLRDSEVAERLEPTPELGAALLGARGKLDRSTEDGLRLVISKVVAQIVERLRTSFRASLSGQRNRFRRSQQKVRQNFDWRRTIAANLRNVDPETGRMLVSDLRFNSRQKRRLPWHVILCVDQSGSMASSVLYSAVCASILASLPGIEVTLLLFDTRVVDLTHLAADPVAVLMTAQLGGGTDIAGVLGVAASKVGTPKRTVITLVSDFEEGGSVSQLLRQVTALREQGVTLLGLAALDEEATPRYDRRVGAMLADRGMHIAALTPDRFAEWLAEVMS